MQPLSQAGPPAVRRTPMLNQYLAAKAQCPDALLMFRMGDFFEMFFEDAKLAARELEITLTARDKGESPVPMAGVPHHAVSGYIARLLQRGYSVALCDQVEDPKAAKGLVKREITRVITPGTMMDLEALEPGRSNYLAAAVAIAHGRQALALLDVLAGELLVTEVDGARVGDELRRMGVRELLSDALSPAALAALVGESPHGSLAMRRVEPVVGGDVAIRRDLQRRFGVDFVGAAAGGGSAAQRRAIANVIAYAEQTQRRPLLHLEAPRAYRAADALVLDEATRQTLELTARAQDGSRQGSLLWHLDRTLTPMGARQLARYLAFPLRDVEAIAARADAVQLLVQQRSSRAALRQALQGVRDLERLVGRVAMERATPRDLGALRASLGRLPDVRKQVAELRAAKGAPAAALRDWSRLDVAPLEAFSQRLARALVEQPPLVANEGGIFAAGFCPALDELLTLSEQGHGFLSALEQRERQATGIGNLKVRYNRVFGYYLEITRANLAQVPSRYVRKQTLVNAERYITEELKQFEEKVLHAEERQKSREAELFAELCAAARALIDPLRALARLLAATDALQSLAEVADRGDYVRPQLTRRKELVLTEARHPVIERLLPGGEVFVPNDLSLQAGSDDDDGSYFLLVTGPNMAGKSTVMRQAALCVVLAHMGSFVPARRAVIGLCDRLFTRVGASDNLTRGHSTFMVEMMETANILAHATSSSLVLLDEIGRGTSTFDGLAIATAVAEDLHDRVRCRTLFSTHYHEMCDLAGRHAHLRNSQMAVRHDGQALIFLRRLVAGAADKSYGIDVARLAGVPAGVLRRARRLLQQMEHQRPAAAQLSLFAAASAAATGPVAAAAANSDRSTPPPEDPLRARLRALDPDHLTPLEALQLLVALRAEVTENSCCT